MAERDLIEQLDASIDAILAGRERETRAIDPELEALVSIAADLRDLPNPEFKALLKWKVVPKIRHTIQPHFRVRGVADIIDFIRTAFNGVEVFRAQRPDGAIAHAEVRVGDSIVEMGEANEQYPPYSFGIHLYVDNVDELYERALQAGATALAPIVDQPYGDREGSVKDRFGNHWYIASPVRAGFRTITPFLHPRGADQMLQFSKAAFGAETLEEPYRTPDGKIAHAVMRIGDSLIEMGEAHDEWQPMEAGIHLFVDDCDAVYRSAIAAGATSVYAPFDAFYGERTSYVVDPFGNHWYIGTPKS
jgi:PhnB protein